VREALGHDAVWVWARVCWWRGRERLVADVVGARGSAVPAPPQQTAAHTPTHTLQHTHSNTHTQTHARARAAHP
jgi:hypothetical protein